MENGAINRAIKNGYNISCSRVCAGINRRSWISKGQQIKNKAIYDAKYRSKNLDKIKKAKKQYHVDNYNPKLAAAHRKKNMQKHVEYCRQPKYKAKKKEYDRRYRAIKNYGEFAECFIALQDVEEAVAAKATNYELKLEKGLLGKSQQRKREYERINSTKSEKCALGNLKRG